MISIAKKDRWSIDSLPHYGGVPKGIESNLAARKRMKLLGDSSPDHAAGIRAMCAYDPLFYINMFVWTYDPRREPPKLPFITYPFQDEAMMELFRAVKEGYDMGIEKSRDMGASWMLLMCFEYLWHFWPSQSFLIVSRKEDLVDKRGDPDSLYWKLDFIHEHQPPWLVPRRGRKKLSLVNLENKSTIDGEATTGDIARGGRRTAIGLDEFASVENGHEVLSATGDATRCRLFNSTPKGTGNAFYDQINGGMKTLRLHWVQHPDKAKSIYYDGNGKPRSPWYDNECNRRSHPMEIAQELDIDYLGSDYQFFDPIVLDDLQRKHAFLPMSRVEVLHDEQTGEFHRLDEIHNGRMKLWVPLHGEKLATMEDRFIVSADIATGTGASNSVLSVGRTSTGEKVGEWVDNETRPEALARVALALCWMCKEISGRPALLIWEANGPGRNFGDVVLESGYRSIYWKEADNRLASKISDIPGWHSTVQSKLALLGEYRRALKEEQFTNPCKESYDEARQYIFMPGGKIAHSRSANRVDPSASNENHGDRVIADALLWKGMGKGVLPKEQKRTTPIGSIAARRDRRKMRGRRQLW